jgi:hypothetical protein
MPAATPPPARREHAPDAPPDAREREQPTLAWASPRIGVAFAIVLAAVTVVAIRNRHNGDGTGGEHHATPHAHASAAATPVSSDHVLEEFLRTWSSTIVGSQGNAPVSDFYADSVQFGGSTAPSSRDAIRRYWQTLFRSGGSFGIDLDRSEWSDTPASLSAGVTPACVNLLGAAGRVLRARVHATEFRPDRVPQIGCQRLEGVYVIDMRRVNGALTICHESWSMRDGICASCPSAPVCANGAATHP